MNAYDLVYDDVYGFHEVENRGNALLTTLISPSNPPSPNRLVGTSRFHYASLDFRLVGFQATYRSIPPRCGMLEYPADNDVSTLTYRVFRNRAAKRLLRQQVCTSY
ncbi:hypothetical protein WA026_011508 [Henosepilachna vigintioctopunctata]|uniref:Uncharacterized protein n=1 Tax=Henosepilachna vigintioctopunctata TaxID=420089 RepID=A0AAW1TT16_9CUCU